MNRGQKFLRFTCVLFVLLSATPQAFAQSNAPRIEVAQGKKQTKNIFELLFGSGDDKKEEPKSVKKKRVSSPSITTLAPSKPLVEKSVTATRLAVFGDSLAIDLAVALETSHAEDPDIVVVSEGVSASGFVRDDYFDWIGAIEKAIEDNSFDIAVISIGVNDRQPIPVDGIEQKPFTEAWKLVYSQRLATFLGALRAAGKPVIWIGLPPMKANSYSKAMTQISSIHRLASFSGGAEFIDIFERFADEDGGYTSYGPDLNGSVVTMRKTDGIHFSRAGAAKLAFYVNQALKTFYRGGAISIEVADVLEGTDAQRLIRIPFQGLGQIRLLEVAGAVMSLTTQKRKSGALVAAQDFSNVATSVRFEDLMGAPIGRADAFGVGIDVSEDKEAAE